MIEYSIDHLNQSSQSILSHMIDVLIVFLIQVISIAIDQLDQAFA
jgi:hypothetical protein